MQAPGLSRTVSDESGDTALRQQESIPSGRERRNPLEGDELVVFDAKYVRTGLHVPEHNTSSIVGVAFTLRHPLTSTCAERIRLATPIRN
jgi:hypothetical protein